MITIGDSCAKPDIPTSDRKSLSYPIVKFYPNSLQWLQLLTTGLL